MRYSSTDVAELEALETAVNALTAGGGGDCPELGMIGILNGLSLSRKRSNVIVLTDAEPKDIGRKDEVIQMANQLENAVHFFLSNDGGGCGDLTAYIEVANATGGVVVNSITDFEVFAQFADAARTFSFIPTGTTRKRQVDKVCIRFNATIFTESVELVVLAPGHTINITKPSGGVTSLIIFSSIGRFSDNTPQPGQYEVCSDMGNFEYALSTPTALDFFVEYLENETYSTEPPPDGMGYIIASTYITVVMY